VRISFAIIALVASLDGIYRTSAMIEHVAGAAVTPPPRAGAIFVVNPKGTEMGLREIAADFDPTGGTDHRKSPSIGPFLNYEIRQPKGTTTILTVLRSTQTAD
jgi:hypothetical protein